MNELLNQFTYLLIYNGNSKENEKLYHKYLLDLTGKTELKSCKNVKSLLYSLGISYNIFDFSEKNLKKLPNIFDTLPDSYEHFVLNKYLIDFANNDSNNSFSKQMSKIIYLNLNSIIENEECMHVSLTFLAILFTLYFKDLCKERLEREKIYLYEYLDDFQSENFKEKDTAIFKHLKFLLNHQNNLIKTRAFSFCNCLNIPLSLTKMISLSRQNVNANSKNLILFLGPTGSGKTTIINYMCGVEYKRHYPENFLVPIKGHTNILPVGYGSVSETFTPQIVRLENLDLCDTAGFFDNRDGDIGICSALSVPIIISRTDKVQAIVVVLESESLDFSKGNRGEIFRKVCQNFGQLIKDFSTNCDKVKNILFIVNDKSSQALDKTEFKLKLENFLDQYEQETTSQKANDSLDEYGRELDKLSLKLKILQDCHLFLNEIDSNQAINEKDFKLFIHETNEIIQNLNDKLDILSYWSNLKKKLQNIKDQGSKLFQNMLSSEIKLNMKLIVEQQGKINELKTLIEEKNAEKLIVKLMLQDFNEESRIKNELNNLIDSHAASDKLSFEQKLFNFLILNGLDEEDSRLLAKEHYEKDSDDFYQLVDLLMNKKQTIFLIKCLKSNGKEQDEKQMLISRLKDICAIESEIDKSLFYFNLYQNQFEKVTKFIEDSIEEITDILNQMNVLYKSIKSLNRDIQIKRDEIYLNEEKLTNLMSLKNSTYPIKLTKENFKIYQFNQAQLEIQKQFYFDINRNIENLENSIIELENEDCVDFQSECKIEKQNYFAKILKIPWTSWLYDKKTLPIERVELSCIKDTNGKIMFKTPIGTCQKSDNLNKIGMYYENENLGLTEIAPGIQQVAILSNQDNLFASTGNFKIEKFNLSNGILKVKFKSQVNCDAYACVRVFVRPKYFEENTNLTLTKEKSIETYRQNLKQVKLKIQELEREQKNEKIFLEALYKGINTSEKTNQLLNTLKTLGYSKQKFLDTFFADFPQVSRLENDSYLSKIQSLLDLSDDDLAQKYNHITKNQLRVYLYGDENANEILVENQNSFEIVCPTDLDRLIEAAHLNGVSFFLLKKILSELSQNENNLNRNDLNSKFESLKQDRNRLCEEMNKWKANYEKKKKKAELLDYVLCCFENQENSIDLIDRYNSLKSSETIKNILEDNFERDEKFFNQDNTRLEMMRSVNQSNSSLEKISSNNQLIVPLKDQETFDSITDDFKFEYISFENSQNAYCASICINRIKSAKVFNKFIFEHYFLS